jgi:8-oxo-dGTP pyrophosphatase MutT (NUDIX family)
METRFEISSGGVIFRSRDEAVEICLIGTQEGTRWQLPKGHVDDDESLEETAVREVLEETGLEGHSLGRIHQIDYWFWSAEGSKKIRHHKVVYFFLLEYVGGDTADHDFEVDAAEWFPVDQAIEKLSYENEQEIARRAREMIGERERESERKRGE